MTTPTKQGVYTLAALNDTDLAEIQQLADICSAHDRIDLRINWDSLRTRSGENNSDFLYYRDNQLVGFLALDGLGDDEAEGTGMVQPDFRRQGIFRALVAAAQAECKQNNTASLILLFDHGSQSGGACAQVLGAQHDFSEHKMRLEPEQAIPQVRQQLDVRAASDADTAALASLLADGFHSSPAHLQEHIANNMRSPIFAYYIALLDQQPIGTLNIQNLSGDAYIYGFVVRPELRGRGYGKEILARAIEHTRAERPQPVYLEVETTNDPAFGLYQAFGFKVMTTYDYYRLATIA